MCVHVRASYVRIVPIVFFLLRKWPRRMTYTTYVYVHARAHAFSKSANVINLLLLIPTSWRGSFYFMAKNPTQKCPLSGQQKWTLLLFSLVRAHIYKDLYCTFGREKNKNKNSNVSNSKISAVSFVRVACVSIRPTSNFRQRSLFISRDSKKMYCY